MTSRGAAPSSDAAVNWRTKAGEPKTRSDRLEVRAAGIDQVHKLPRIQQKSNRNRDKQRGKTNEEAFKRISLPGSRPPGA